MTPPPAATSPPYFMLVLDLTGHQAGTVPDHERLKTAIMGIQRNQTWFGFVGQPRITEDRSLFGDMQLHYRALLRTVGTSDSAVQNVRAYLLPEVARAQESITDWRRDAYEMTPYNPATDGTVQWWESGQAANVSNGGLPSVLTGPVNPRGPNELLPAEGGPIGFLRRHYVAVGVGAAAVAAAPFVLPPLLSVLSSLAAGALFSGGKKREEE